MQVPILMPANCLENFGVTAHAGKAGGFFEML